MIAIVFIIYWRVFRLRESAVWVAAKKRERDQLRETMLLFHHFWHRCVALCLHHTLACGRTSAASLHLHDLCKAAIRSQGAMHRRIAHDAFLCAGCHPTRQVVHTPLVALLALARRI